ncbi:MAG: hypothetical protein A3D10_07770 [Omnitrophica WOR_2 bacterium RIFCSPHIGHO2_02_FULL_48_11]|nr:MAG: hypothetical protein A3D10_07770 [Omnitrophica WOR_2 bacterium RIFCSPHIGHO2_02_FULL_48_11]
MKNKIPIHQIKKLLLISLIGIVGCLAYFFYDQFILQNKILKQIISRLEADSRIAEVFVTDVVFNPLTNQHMTTIKFMEYDTQGKPLPAKYFTFVGNIIQFQSLVVRFADKYVRAGDVLRGKSVYLFWKVFILDGERTQEYEIAKLNDIPPGYKIDGPRHPLEDEIWRNFWAYALDSKAASQHEIKNAQIEAPGTKFVPGLLYTLKIEYDGGIRIDVTKIPQILEGEKVLASPLAL